MEQRDFFISYTNADEAWAVWIANVLKSNGYTVYIQAFDIKPGDIFPEKMNEFLKSSANFIAVWSARYFASQYCKDELNGAYIQRNKGQMKYLFLVRIDNYPIEPLYAGLVHIALPDMGAASETKLVSSVRDAVPPQDDAEALYERGDDYYYGENGVMRDYAKARKYYELAAAKGHIVALNDLGEIYRYGLAVTQDYAKARKYYEQAAAQGDETALYNLGELYEYGEGVSIDYAKALEYYKKADDAGEMDAPAKIEQLRRKLRGE